MYRLTMEQGVRDDITAAAAAHHELGREYDGAVAEGLIEQIGAEIDKRVDARLAQQDGRPARRGRDVQPSPVVRSSREVIVLGLGSMFFGFMTTGVVLSRGGSGAVAVLIWIIIGIINVSYARRN
jgi:hypothetical protein